MSESARDLNAYHEADSPVENGRGPHAVGWDHIVQFYEADEFLCDAVAEFLAEGLRRGERAVALTTVPHRDGIIERLAAMGVKWDQARLARRITWLDARAVLESVMVGREPDDQRFDAHVGRLMRRVIGSGEAPGVRAYGELVDLLWREGNADAALHLEDLWNELGRAHSFSLLCGYSKGNIYRESRGHRHRQVCDRHARVLPSETGEPVYAGD